MRHEAPVSTLSIYSFQSISSISTREASNHPAVDYKTTIMAITMRHKAPVSTLSIHSFESVSSISTRETSDHPALAKLRNLFRPKKKAMAESRGERLVSEFRHLFDGHQHLQNA